MSELDFGLRGLMLVLPGIVRQEPKLIGGTSLEAHMEALAGLRRDLGLLAQDLGLRLVALKCDDIEHFLNDVRARRIKVQYGKARPAAMLPAIHNMRRALVQRWDDLLNTLAQFMNANALLPASTMRTEAMRIDAEYANALLSTDGPAMHPKRASGRLFDQAGRILPKEDPTGTPMHNRTLSHVLLVDDEEEICQLLSSILKRLGSECVFAHNLAEGREALANVHFDAVFLDVNLPDGLGYELIPEIKARVPGAQCITISALDHERARAVSAGADSFIPKPFSRDVLFSSLRALGFNA